jgi:HK97 family phage prohead protease/HK97 family phage major capsid protein
MNRAYSTIEIKNVNEDQRIIEGIATTPQTDRMGDIVEPRGAKFSLPIPFLWQHRHDSPIGHVTHAKVTDDGISVRVQLAKTDEPGELKNLLDLAWQSIKLGLVRGLSIGFAPIGEPEVIKGTWGFRFKEWDWVELSGVTIPANVGANIAAVKSYDEGTPALPSTKAAPVDLPTAAGSGTKPKTKARAMTITEQIREFEATRQSKDARRTELMNKAAGEKRTLDEQEEEEYDTLTVDIEKTDKHLVRLREQEKQNIAAAKPVDATNTKTAADSRNTSVVVALPEKLEKGIEFARFAMCVAAAEGNVERALQLAKTHYPQQQRAIDVLANAAQVGRRIGKHLETGYRSKAAVPAGDTQDATYASPLVAYNTFAGDFIDFLRPQTIIGQLDGRLRRIPFNVHIKGQTSGGTGYWVGEGAPKPVTAFDFNDTYHEWTKIACIAVLTDELIRFSDPSAERLVRDALAGAVIERMDSDFTDPAITATAGVRPASITAGLTPIASSGTDINAVGVDLAALWAPGIAANLPLTNAVYITTPAVAMQAGLLRSDLGVREFDGLGVNGGSLGGIPVIVSNYVDAGLFILAFASEIYLSDDGQVTIDSSNQASIQMLDNPTNTPVGTTVATSMVSMFQTNSTALRAERFIHWSKRRSAAVALLEDVAWGPTVASA